MEQYSITYASGCGSQIADVSGQYVLGKQAGGNALACSWPIHQQVRSPEGFFQSRAVTTSIMSVSPRSSIFATHAAVFGCFGVAWGRVTQSLLDCGGAYQPCCNSLDLCGPQLSCVDRSANGVLCEPCGAPFSIPCPVQPFCDAAGLIPTYSTIRCCLPYA